MRRIVIIGATGSVARSTFRVIDQHPDQFKVVGLAARTSGASLLRLAQQYRVQTLCLYDCTAAKNFRTQAESQGCRLLPGEEGLKEICTLPEVDIILAASPGTEALDALICGLEAKKTLALANKESLVLGGHIFMQTAKENDATIIPLDSEHSAIFQCIQGIEDQYINKIVLTASGGPFLHTDLRKLKDVRPHEALAHPTWAMGPKISLDCATMANKGLELMEAFWLFGLKADQIDAWVHPQSIVHGLVETQDKALIAHMGLNDMALPIQYGLFYPDRKHSHNSLPLSALRELNFFPPEKDRYPCFYLAKESLKKGGHAPCVFNASNTVAGKAFLEERISFVDIPSIIDKALQEFNTGSLCSLEDMRNLEQTVFRFCNNLIFKS